MERLNELWREFLEHHPNNEGFRYIIWWVMGPLKEKAAEMLLERNPSLDDLRTIYKRVPSLREKVREKLSERNLTEEDLGHFIDPVPTLSEGSKRTSQRSIEDIVWEMRMISFDITYPGIF